MKNLFMLLAGLLTAASVVACDSEQIEPTRFSTEYYRIANEITSDIVIEINDDAGTVFTVVPGETQDVFRQERRWEPGIAYSMVWLPSYWSMKIDGEVITEFIWSHDYWESVSEDGEDDHHTNVICTLTVTAELLQRADERAQAAAE